MSAWNFLSIMCQLKLQVYNIGYPWDKIKFSYGGLYLSLILV